MDAKHHHQQRADVHPVWRNLHEHAAGSRAYATLPVASTEVQTPDGQRGKVDVVLDAPHVTAQYDTAQAKYIYFVHDAHRATPAALLLHAVYAVFLLLWTTETLMSAQFCVLGADILFVIALATKTRLMWIVAFLLMLFVFTIQLGTTVAGAVLFARSDYAWWLTTTGFVMFAVAALAVAAVLLMCVANIVDAYMLSYDCDTALEIICPENTTAQAPVAFAGGGGGGESSVALPPPLWRRAWQAARWCHERLSGVRPTALPRAHKE